MNREPVIIGASQLKLVDGMIPRPATVLSVQAQAARSAADDAGIDIHDIDGLLVAGSWALPGPGILPTVAVGEYLGISPQFTDSTNIGGSAFEAHVAHASHAIEASYCDVALIVYGSLQRTERSRTLEGRPPVLNMQFETPFGLPSTVGSYAMAAMRHMYEYGTRSEDLAAIAVAARNWARLNPEATRREPMTIDDALASRMVCDPLRVSDCCLKTDGAAAIIMTSAEHARAIGARGVSVLGYAEHQSHWTVSQMPSLTETPAMHSGSRALSMAGLSPDQIDVVELYDSFTITTLLALEDLGFVPKGEGGRFVSEVGIGPGGGLPVNTNGGGLSFAHPGMYGLFLLVEAVRQLRGEAGDRQVPGARHALVSGMGGVLSTAATCVLGRFGGE